MSNTIFQTRDNVGTMVTFKAQYLNQKVLASFKDNYCGIVTPYELMRFGDWLWLRPVSALLINEAYDIIELLDIDPEAYRTDNALQLADFTEFVEALFTEPPGLQIDSFDSTQLSNLLDYLRFRGFAIPWRGLSVDEQIKRGYIKLTNTFRTSEAGHLEASNDYLP